MPAQSKVTREEEAQAVVAAVTEAVAVSHEIVDTLNSSVFNEAVAKVLNGDGSKAEKEAALSEVLKTALNDLSEQDVRS